MSARPNEPTSGFFTMLESNSPFQMRETPPWPSWGYALLAWPFLGMGTVTYVSAIGEAQVAPHQAEITGAVTGYDAPNHNQCRYEFTVNHRQYRGESGFPAANNPPIASTVAVYYDTRNPTVNCLESYALLADKNRSLATLLYLLGIGIIATVSIAMLRKRHQSKNQ